MAKAGRPSKFTQEIANTICGRLVAGESLNAICRDDAMPSIRAVYEWLASNEKFAQQYARAREDQADTLADDILTIADDENIPSDSRRIRVDARKWTASKLKPKKYGDKIDATIDGNVTVELVRFASSPRS